MAEIKLTVRSNFSKATAAIKSFGEVTGKEAQRIEKFRQKFGGTEIDSFIRKNQQAAAAVLATRGPLEAASSKQAGLRRKMEQMIRGGINPQEESLKKLQREYEKASKKVRAHSQAQKISENAVRSATIALGAMAGATAVLGAKGVKAYSEYSKSLANVNTLIPISASEMGTLDDELNKLSVDFATHKTELAGGVYQAVSAGANNLGEALEIVEASARLGTGALIDNSTAVDIITTAMNSYGAETVGTQEAIDSFFMSIKQGKLSGEELSQSIGKSISVFAGAKLPLDQLSAGLAYMTIKGKDTAIATTQLNSIVTKFLDPTVKMEAALRAAGYASGMALLESEGLAGAIGFVQEATGGASDEMLEMMGTTEAYNGIVTLASETGASFADTLEEFAGKAGVADEALRVQTEGVAAGAFKMEQLQVVLKNLSIELGEKLMPPLAKVAQKLLNFINDADRMRRTFRLIVPLLGTVAAALGTMLIITKIVSLVKSFTAVMGALNIVLAANPIIAIGMAVIALIAAIVLLYKNWDKVVIFFKESGAKLKEKLGQMGAAIATGWTVAIQKLKIIFINIIMFIADKFLGLVQNILGGLDKIAKIAGMEVFGRLNDGVSKWREGLEAAKVAAVETSNAIIEKTKEQRRIQKEATNAELQEIKDTAAERQATIEEMEENAEIATGGGDGGEEKQKLKDQLADYAGFLQDRIKLRKMNFDEQKQFLETKRAEIATIEGIGADERAAALQAIDNQEKRRIDDISSYHINVLRERLAAESMDLIGRKQFLADQAAEIRDLESLTNDQKTAALQAIRAEEKKLIDDVTSHYIETYQTRMENAGMDFEARKEFLAAQQEELRELQILDADERMARQQAITDEEKRLLDDVTNHHIEALQLRMDNDAINAEERLISLQEQAQAIIANEQLTADQKALILAWVAAESLRLEKMAADDAKQHREKTLKEMQGLFGAIESLVTAAGVKSREAAIAAKALASAQALINSYLAFTKILWEQPGELFSKLIAAATILASGIAAQVKIASTPIPSAEIGGQFAVPDSGYSSRGDSQLLRVNPGEQVDVAPRGEEDQGNLTVITQIEGQSIYSVVNTGFRSGQVVTITPDNNFGALSLDEAEDF